MKSARIVLALLGAPTLCAFVAGLSLTGFIRVMTWAAGLQWCEETASLTAFLAVAIGLVGGFVGAAVALARTP